MKKSILFSILFLLLLQIHSQSFFTNNQPPRFGLLDRADGLVSLSVSSIQQDKYGFMWFGSQGGLNRYDGVKTEVFTHDPFDKNTIANDLVQTIYYDEENNIMWVGTYSGLSGLNIDTREVVHYQKDNNNPEKTLSNNIVVSITKDNKNNLWVGTMDGLNKIDLTNSSITHIKTENSTIRSLLFDTNNTLWIGTLGGLNYIDDIDNNIVKKTPMDFPSQYFMAITESEPGKLILGLWGYGLVEYWPEKNIKKQYPVPDNKIYTVLESSDGTLWAGSWGGGLWSKPMNGEAVWFENSENSELSNSVIYALFQDKGGIVWVGTNGGGVHYLSPRRNNYRFIGNDSINNLKVAQGKIDVVYKDSQDFMYISVYGAGLYILKNNQLHLLKHSDSEESLLDNIVNSVFEDSNNNLWVASNGGLQLLNRSDLTFKNWSQIHPQNKLSHDIITFITEDSKKNLWIGTYGEGINIYNSNTDSLKVLKNTPDDINSLSDNIIYYIYETSMSDIWIGTNNGLNLYNPVNSSFKTYFHDSNNSNSLTGNNIRAINEDFEGNLWIGTYSAGINKKEKNNDIFSHYTTKSGLSSNNILSIIVSDDNRVWLGTRSGINIISEIENKIDIIDERDGLFGVLFNIGHYKDRDGSLFFGGTHGVTKINSHKMYVNSHKPDVHITNIAVMGKDLPKKSLVLDGQKIKISYKTNFFRLEFIGLDYESPNRNSYEYKMEGFDKDWIKNNNRTYANYTNLKPGEYEFKVKASNNDQIWSDGGASIFIKILSPWYLTWWAFLLYFAFTIFTLYILWKWRESHLIAEQNKKLEYTNNLLEKANCELEQLTIRDNLTGLYNRRYFDNNLPIEVFRAIRTNSPISVLMIDIDDFKIYNDNFGHLMGDKVLKIIADTLQISASRTTDFITRFGGEEFVIVLLNTDIVGANLVASNIHSVLKDKKESLTVSIGVHTEIPNTNCDPLDLVKKADDTLYKAKKSGKNKTCFSTD